VIIACYAMIPGLFPGIDVSSTLSAAPGWQLRRRLPAWLSQGLDEAVQHRLASRLVELDRELVAVHRLDGAGTELGVKDPSRLAEELPSLELARWAWARCQPGVW
jgi:hypothetical protein